MAWCITPVPWGNSTTGQLTTSVFGGGYTGNGSSTFDAGTTPQGWVSLQNDKDRLTPWFWTYRDGCICVENTQDPTALPEAIKWAVAGGDTAVTPFAEVEKVDEELIQACKECFEDLFGCSFDSLIPEDEPLDKAAIAAAVQAGIDSLPDTPAPQTFSAEIVGWNKSDSGDWLYGDWGTPVGNIGATVNPAGTPGQQIGTLFIDPNLPAGVNSFDLTYTILDSTGGMGTVGAVEKSTGVQIPGGGYASGAGGPAQGPVPFDHTVSFTIPVGVDPTDICVVINAFGVAPTAPSDWGQDEIDPNPETLVVVTPSACSNANICFEDIFGCSMSDMLASAGFDLSAIPDSDNTGDPKLVDIFQFGEGEAGFRARWWGMEAGPHLHPDEWAGPADYTGFNLPTAAAPDVDVIDTATQVVDSPLDARYGIVDGWFYVEDGFVQDTNRNTGELGAVYLASGCNGVLARQPGGNQTVNTNGVDATLLDPVPVSAGWYYMVALISDFSAFSGIGLEYSADGETYSAVTQRQVSKPEVVVDSILECDPVPEGWSLHPPAPCCDPVVVGGGPELVPSTLVPVADNQIDDLLRQGIAGTTGEFSDAGHVHPIRRQVHPDWPGVTVNANVSELIQETVLDRRSTEEWIEFEVRVRVSVDAGTGWPIITVPAIAGFQQPIITVTNTYRNPTSTFQGDDGAGGAAPLGPYMGIEWSHWTSTRGLYGPFRRDNDITSWYVGFSAMYVRL